MEIEEISKLTKRSLQLKLLKQLLLNKELKDQLEAFQANEQKRKAKMEDNLEEMNKFRKIAMEFHLFDKSRNRELSYQRMIMRWWLSINTNLSQKAIAKVTGNADRTSVYNAVRQHNNLTSYNDKEYLLLTKDILKRLNEQL